MHKTVLFFVLLFLPGTSLIDWQHADAPSLHRLMQQGALGLMNCRTAERDKISALAGERSVLAGARLYGTREEGQVGYLAKPDNLEDGLLAAGTAISVRGPVPMQSVPYDGPMSQRRFVVATLPDNWRDADAQIGYWAGQARNYGGRLLIVSPNPSLDDYAQMRQLTPVLLWGDGISPGLLSSASTRTPGLIVNTDIAPTIAWQLGAKLPIPAYGTAASIKQVDGDAVSDLEQRETTWVRQANSLRLLPFAAGFVAFLVLLTTSLTRLGEDFTGRLAAFCVTIPLILLVSSSTAVFIILTVLATAVSLINPAPHRAVNAIALVVALVVTLDALLFSGRVTGGAMLGYSPIEGARFYGIGNETLGLYAGALVVITTLLGRLRSSRTWIAALWTVAGLVLALPESGAKAGGLIVCAIVLSVTLSTGDGKKLSGPRTITWATAAIFAAVGLLVLISHIGPKTHVTQAVTLAGQAGARTIGGTIFRKAAMDLHLVFHSVWIWVLLTTSAGRWQLYRKAGPVTPILSTSVGLAATAACLLFNDAGVVAAALCGLVVWGMEITHVLQPHHYVRAGIRQ